MNPSGPPPPYEDASNRPPNPDTSSNTAQAPTHSAQPTTATDTTHLAIPSSSNDSHTIPPPYRRSMEDEHRPLPQGWIRQYDVSSHHQFYVDTTASPPRSIWHHPLDDESYLATLPDAERQKVTSVHNPQTHLSGYESDEGGQSQHHPPKGAANQSLSEKLKDKLTGSTHSEREAQRAQREAEERAMYEQHQQFRAAMARALQTGEPQFLGQDRDGRDVFVEPPFGVGGYGGGGFGGRGYGISPYARGVYANPNARFVRPAGPYGRPGGVGYGGGLGTPLMPLMLLGGLGTGMVAGSMF